jgi:regulation of enolase protein 1 (concanavalin A-like superfamily)
MFWSIETSDSCNNLSVVVTHEHADSASSTTRL